MADGTAWAVQVLFCTPTTFGNIAGVLLQSNITRWNAGLDRITESLRWPKSKSISQVITMRIPVYNRIMQRTNKHQARGCCITRTSLCASSSMPNNPSVVHVLVSFVFLGAPGEVSQAYRSACFLGAWCSHTNDGINLGCIKTQNWPVIQNTKSFFPSPKFHVYPIRAGPAKILFLEWSVLR